MNGMWTAGIHSTSVISVRGVRVGGGGGGGGEWKLHPTLITQLCA